MKIKLALLFLALSLTSFSLVYSMSESFDEMLVKGVKHSEIDLVKKALESGADVNKKSGEIGYTPLHWAINQGDKNIVQILLESGADMHIKCNSCKASSLDFAEYYSETGQQDKNIVQILHNWRFLIEAKDNLYFTRDIATIIAEYLFGSRKANKKEELEASQ